MNELYDVLEICLQEIEKGTDLETVLSQHPEFADELRPILETSIQAILLADLGPSADVERRGRARVMQQAAQMREAQARPSRRIWSVPLRRALVSMAVIAVLFISSTNLVRASSTTIPGDNLYPVKRTWEDVSVLLTFDNQAREALEVEHENERLHELNDLFAEGRSAKVNFAGTVTNQNGDLWLVSTIPVLVSAQTQFATQPVTVGNAIRVRGYTRADGTVLAESVDLLPAGMPLPTMNDNRGPENEQENSGTGQTVGEDGSGKGSGDEMPTLEATKPSHEGSDVQDSSKDSGSDSGVSSNDGENRDHQENDNSGSNTNDNTHEEDSKDSNNTSAGGDD